LAKRRTTSSNPRVFSAAFPAAPEAGTPVMQRRARSALTVKASFSSALESKEGARRR